MTFNSRNMTLGLVLCFAAPHGTQAAEFDANLVWSDRTALSLPISGQIKEVHVRAGQNVSVGAPLVSLDARHLDARLAEARAGLKALDRVSEFMAGTDEDQAWLRGYDAGQEEQRKNPGARLLPEFGAASPVGVTLIDPRLA